MWTVRLPTRRGGFVVTCHPDHLESLLKAKPADAPSLTGESPLRPILGPNSILTSVGDRHMRQRKLLLPPFHGEAARYVEMIAEVADREIDGWPVNQPFAPAPRMQAVTLAVKRSWRFGEYVLPGSTPVAVSIIALHHREDVYPQPGAEAARMRNVTMIPRRGAWVVVTRSRAA